MSSFQNMRGSSKDVLVRAIHFCHHHAVVKKHEASQRISTSFISFLDQLAYWANKWPSLS